MYQGRRCNMLRTTFLWTRNIRVALALAIFLITCIPNSFSRSADDIPTHPSPDTADSLHWGLPDRTIEVGRVFQYKLPTTQDNGDEHLLTFQMTEEDERDLPDWLYWNKETNSIEGLATAELNGEVVGVHVTSRGVVTYESDTSSEETFFIKVVESSDQREELRPSSEAAQSDDKTIHCGAGSPVTSATVILDVLMEDLQARERVELLRRFSAYLELPIFALSLSPGGERPLWHEEALVAGPGDTASPNNLPGSLIQWVVGCGSVRAVHMMILQQLEVTAGNGSLGRALDEGVVGWYITNDRETKQNKIKRQASLHPMPTRTLLPSIGHPTAYPSVTRVVHETYHSGGQPYKPQDLPSSMWLRPQLEIFITTKAVASRPPRPTDSYEYGTSSASSIIQPTRTVDAGYSTPWSGQYPPDYSTGYSGKPTPGYPEYIEPSMEYGPSSRVTPTASLPEWSSEIYSSPGSTSRYPYTDKPSEKEDWSSTYPYTDGTSVTQGSTTRFPHTDDSSGDPRTRVLWSTESSGGWQSSSTQGPTSGWISPTSVYRTIPPTKTFTPKQKFTKKPPSTETIDTYPRLVNPLPKLSAEVGKLLWFKIPSDTFYDEKDGFTNNLNLLMLLNEDRTTVSPASWIKLNESSQTLYGLALEDHIGSHRFIVAAVDSDRQITESPLEVNVRQADNVEKINHEFSVKLDIGYTKFKHDVDFRLAVLNKIARAFGDKNISMITVTRIEKGSVVIYWTNNSLPLEPCPSNAIIALNEYLLLPDGTLNQTFVNAMLPYGVLDASGAPHGSCAFDNGPTTEPPADSITLIATEPDQPARKEVPSSSFLLYVVIAIIIFLIILLILVIVCVICYKRQRSRREKDQEEKLGGAHKGVPVIFADELDESGIGNGGDDATPVSTLKSVKSIKDTDTIESVPPPEYSRSKPTSASSTLRSDWKAPLLSEHDDIANDERESTLEKRNLENDLKKESKNGSKNNVKAVR